MRTAHLAPIVKAHSWCNLTGLPSLSFLDRRQETWKHRYAVAATYVAGIAMCALSLGPARTLRAMHLVLLITDMRGRAGGTRRAFAPRRARAWRRCPRSLQCQCPWLPVGCLLLSSALLRRDAPGVVVIVSCQLGSVVSRHEQDACLTYDLAVSV